jgi:hypothetical protein
MAYLGSSLYKLGRRVALAVGSSVGVETLTISATTTLTAQSAVMLFIDGGAASRDVGLPVDADLVGAVQFIKNTGTTNNLVVKYSSTTVATLAPGEWAIFGTVTGLVWYGAAFGSAFGNILTTTDGVASGDTRRVGGSVHTKTSETIVVNTTTETTIGSHSLAANMIKAGTRVRVRGSVRVTGVNATPTVTLRLKLGSTTYIASAALNVIANDVMVFDTVITGRAAAGAAAEVAIEGVVYATQSGTPAVVPKVVSPANYATNGALAVSATVQWSAAHASNSLTCDSFAVDVVG